MNGRYRYFLCALSPTYAQFPPLSTSSPTMIHCLQLMNLHWHIGTTQNPLFPLGFTFGVLHATGLDIYLWCHILWLPGGTVVKNPSASAGDARDTGLILALGRFPGGGYDNPFQYSCLENPMDRGTWQTVVHTVTQSWTWLNWLSMHVLQMIMPVHICYFIHLFIPSTNI